MKHVKSFTYKPKIDAVFDGRCRQTIRRGNKVKVGDEILFHTWTGRPYASKWGKRIRVKVNKVFNVKLSDKGITEKWVYGGNPNQVTWFWEGGMADWIAERDFIDPPTGLGLKAVLSEKNKNWEGDYQIIRW